jgi:hypothetical protein
LREDNVGPGQLRIDQAVKEAERGDRRIGETKRRVARPASESVRDSSRSLKSGCRRVTRNTRTMQQRPDPQICFFRVRPVTDWRQLKLPANDN